MKKLSQFALQAISLTSFLALWQLVIVAGIIPNYLVPTPVQVIFALGKDFQLLKKSIRTASAKPISTPITRPIRDSRSVIPVCVIRS